MPLPRTIRVSLRMLWLAACAAALFAALHGYAYPSDWKAEEALAAQMIVLGFPISLAVVLVLVAAGAALKLVGMALPASSPVEMVCWWALFVVAGYLQWFVFLGRIIRWQRSGKVHTQFGQFS